jgi:Kef-type K+ transport system membrane component KefB
VLTEHQLLLFWLQVLALFAVARALGWLAQRLGQPRVVGELAAGLALGPSVLGQLAPGIEAWLFPPDPVQGGLLVGLGWIGAFLLLIVTGLETDLALVRRMWRATAHVAIGSLLIPVVFGFGMGFSMPRVFLGESATREVFALFMATALGISALPVIAKVLFELDLMRRNVAQVIVAAAMVNDVVGWILLGVVAGFAHSGTVEVGRLAVPLLGLALFLAFAFTVGARLADALLREVRRRGTGTAGALTATLLVALCSGSLTHALGLEAVLGAFIAGIVLGNSRFQDHEVFPHLQTLTLAFFAPLFFAAAGLRADLRLLADPTIAAWGAIVLVAASLSKFLGAYLGARVAGLPFREGLAVGAGLNARGAVEIVVATVGLSLGVLNPSSYTVVVLMAMATSMMAPPLLRALLRGWKGSPEERERLDHERRLKGNVLVRPTRILLPSHGGPNSILAAHIVDLAWPEQVEVTALSVGADVPAQDLDKLFAVFERRRVRHEHTGAKDALKAILEHAGLGYGAIAVGATDTRIAGRLVSPVIDALLSASPLPVIMVRGGAPGRSSARFRRILVPAIGTQPGRAAQEIAFGLASPLDAQVLIAHVVTIPTVGQSISLPVWSGGSGAVGETDRPEFADVAERVVGEAVSLADEMGVRAEAAIRTGVSAPEEILALAREHDVDLIVLAANLRQFSGRPFLGHGVEYLLERSESAVVVVTAPPGWTR